MAFMPLKRMTDVSCLFSNSCVLQICINRRFSLPKVQKWKTRHHLPRTKMFLPVCYFSSAFTTSAVSNEVTVHYQQGLPVISVPLPSRRERCRFTLKPVTSTVGDFLADIQREDKGADRVLIQSTDGTRVASSTLIASLMQEDFHLVVNDVVYLVKPPDLGKLTSEELENLSTVRARVAQLYVALNVDQHQLDVERRLVSQMERLREELEPLEKKKEEILHQASKRSTILSWFGLALMGAQFGILARLTWWEYSWDIMEPVTYFITYGTTIVMYAYFILTRQEYVMPDVCDRQTLYSFHKWANKQGLDVQRYNSLRNSLAQIEDDLRRLRDPLQLHLPMKDPSAQLQYLNKENSSTKSS